MYSCKISRFSLFSMPIKENFFTGLDGLTLYCSRCSLSKYQTVESHKIFLAWQKRYFWHSRSSLSASSFAYAVSAYFSSLSACTCVIYLKSSICSCIQNWYTTFKPFNRIVHSLSIMSRSTTSSIISKSWRLHSSEPFTRKSQTNLSMATLQSYLSAIAGFGWYGKKSSSWIKSVFFAISCFPFNVLACFLIAYNFALSIPRK